MFALEQRDAGLLQAAVFLVKVGFEDSDSTDLFY